MTITKTTDGQFEPKRWAVDEAGMRGLALRLDMLETHYRKPKDVSATSMNRALKTIRRWLSGETPIPHWVEAQLSAIEHASSKRREASK